MLFQELVGLTGVPSRLGAPKHMSYKNDLPFFVAIATVRTYPNRTEVALTWRSSSEHENFLAACYLERDLLVEPLRRCRRAIPALG